MWWCRSSAAGTCAAGPGRERRLPAVQDELVGVDDAPLAHARARARPRSSPRGKGPTTSAFRLWADTACCLSASELMVSMRALMRPARSKSSSAAASAISAESSSTNSRCCPGEEALDAAYVHGVLLGRDGARSMPRGPSPHAQSKHGRTSELDHRERIVLKLAVRAIPPIGARRRRTGARPAARCPPCGGPRGYRCRVRSSACRRLCFSRVYLMAGNTSPLVSAMNG